MDTETPFDQWTSCEWYGCDFEIVLDDAEQPVIIEGGWLRRCTDCGNEYTD